MIFINVLIAVQVLALLIGIVRMLIGPSVMDRVLVFDLFASIGVGLLITLAVKLSQPIYLDIGIGLAVVSFLGTVGFAIYTETQKQGDA